MSAARPSLLWPTSHGWRPLSSSIGHLKATTSVRYNPEIPFRRRDAPSTPPSASSTRSSYRHFPSSSQWSIRPRRDIEVPSTTRRLISDYSRSKSPINYTRAGTSPLTASSILFARPSTTAYIEYLARNAPTRSLSTNPNLTPRVPRRTKSSKSTQKAEDAAAAERAKNAPAESSSTPEGASPAPVSKYFHLPTLPHLPHRPTREEFLAAANGFWERMKVRFKWASIRSMRPWNIDEWGAFVSWFFFGHLLWILVGTTTFFSLMIFSINTVFAQETLAKWVGDYLTESAGLTVVFESAIVPKWKDGVISFKNVFVSRRPKQTKSSVSKGSSSSAAAVAAAERDSTEEDDGNYTQFNITLNTVNVTLSFVKWWNGKGLLKDVEIKGVRGVMDRTSIKWSAEYVDPLSYRHEHHPGDFEIDAFKLEDLLLTVHQPGGFRPFSVSIYSCQLPQLRKQYLFYDFLSANHMSGSFDGSLFTIHPRQVHGVSPGDERVVDPLGEPNVWKKLSRLRIDGLKIDHLNRTVEGPFGWIYEGNVDIVADIRFPADDDDSITKVMSDFYDKLEDAVTSNRYFRLLDSNPHRNDEIIFNDPGSLINVEVPEGLDTTPATPKPTPPRTEEPASPTKRPSPSSSSSSSSTTTPDEKPPRYLVMDLRIHLNDVKATVPVFHSNLSYVNQALVRPIVAYINAKRTYIPIGCRVVKRASDFDGSWSIYDCGLMDDASAEVYDAFARDVEDQQSRARRLRKVGFWTLSLAVHALFMGMAGNVI